MSVVVLIGLLILACLTFAWIIPLVIGLVNYRKTWGKVILVVGGVWGVAAVLGIGSLLVFGFTRGIRETRSYTEFDVNAYTGPVGRISIPIASQANLILTRDDGQQVPLSSTNGLFSIPTGRYRLYYYYATVSDEQNVPWNVACQLYKKEEYVSIGTNTVGELALGPPFSASVTVNSQQSGRLALEYFLQDDQSRCYTMQRTDAETKPPGFEMLDAEGTVVFTGSFKYG